MNETQIVKLGVFDLISQSGPMVQLVLLLLLGASVLSWGIIIAKVKGLKLTERENVKFLEIFWNSKNLDECFGKIEQFNSSSIAGMFKSGFKELKKLSVHEANSIESTTLEVENVQRALFRASQDQIGIMESHVSWLATIASAAPFVGLFGTVWGIMNSFQNIGATGSANLAVVAPGISEALIATAIGLATAIPAVIAYNFFASKIRKLSKDMECFGQDFLNIVQRGFLGKAKN
jgi:biopolymer transport protein TolQ